MGELSARRSAEVRMGLGDPATKISTSVAMLLLWSGISSMMLLLLDVEEVSCSGSIACALFEPKQQSGRVITLWSGIGGRQLLVTFTLDALQTTETSHS